MCVFDVISVTCDLQVPAWFWLSDMCFRGSGEQQQIFHPGGCLQQHTETSVLQHELDLRWEIIMRIKPAKKKKKGVMVVEVEHDYRQVCTGFPNYKCVTEDALLSIS